MRGLCSIIFLMACVGCIEPYYPRVTSEYLNMLVIDGGIGTDGNASVILTRSTDMNTSSLINPEESGADVTIESSSGNIFSLSEETAGTYTASGLDVNYNDRFILHVKTASGGEYESDEVQIYPTPPIDSVYFVVGATGQTLEVRVNANDTNPGATGYYSWDCTETYEYRAALHSPYKLVGQIAVLRLPEEEVFYCWKDHIVPSKTFSTKGLSQNLLSGIPVAVIEKYSKKISVRYSILIKQRAISEKEYSFRAQLKASTELTGSLFSVIPGTVVSNVHSTAGTKEYVLGYFRAQDVKQQRFFIDFDELPAAFKQQLPVTCDIESTCRTDMPPGGPSNCLNILNLSSNVAIIDVIVNGGQEQVSVTFTSAECGDCRASGGTTTKPSFWK